MGTGVGHKALYPVHTPDYNRAREFEISRREFMTKKRSFQQATRRNNKRKKSCQKVQALIHFHQQDLKV